MSVLDKRLLLSDIEKKLNAYIPADTVRQILNDAGEALTNYEVTAIHPDDGGEDETDQLIRLFLDAKEIEGKSQNTIYQYRYKLKRLHQEVKVPFRKMTVYHLRQYMMAEKDRGISLRTLNGDRDVYCSCFGWLYKEGLIQANPCANLSVIKTTDEQVMPFTATEVQLIKEAAENTAQNAIVHFLLSTGCRISEVCAVNRQDLDFHGLKLEVLGKGNKKRTVYIDEVTAMLLQRYLNERTDTDPALFVSRIGTRYTDGGIQTMLRKLGDRAGVEKVHPHRFRHTLATNLIDKGMSVQEVAAILGHENINTTMTYVYVNQRNVENAYRKYA